MKQQDLSRLTSVDLLDLAILAEEEALERYREFADQMELHHNAQAAAFFRQMQARELDHLHQRQEERKRHSDLPTTVDPLHFFDPVEAPPYETSHYKMTPAHIFQVTLAAEWRAVAFYKKLAESLTDPEARAMARSFWEEEVRHVEWAEEELKKLPPIPAGWEEDYDEPVSQD